VFADLAAAVADGADYIDAVGQLCGDREHVFGATAHSALARTEIITFRYRILHVVARITGVDHPNH
jgi:hypothetical protein